MFALFSDAATFSFIMLAIFMLCRLLMMISADLRHAAAITR